MKKTRATIMSFEGWVAHSFDHPVSEPAWYWDDDLDEQWTEYISPETFLEYFTRLMREPAVMQHFTREQIAQGLWFLLSGVFLVDALPRDFTPQTEDGVRCLEAIVHFFRTWVAPQEMGSGMFDGDPIAIVIFMWWDLWPWTALAGPKGDLQALREILHIPSLVCRESALHGLGHMHGGGRSPHDRVIEHIIDSFTATTADLSPELLEYAQKARAGDVQ